MREDEEDIEAIEGIAEEGVEDTKAAETDGGIINSQEEE
jgi:hypothetical protein